MKKIQKYKIEHLKVNEFIADMAMWLREIGWLQTEEEAEISEFEEKYN